MMKLAAQKFIELKSEHFGKGSMSVFGGEFIKRLFLKADPPSDALAPIAEADENDVDEAASADATVSEIASNADALSSADVAALQAGIRAAAETEAPASKPQPKEPSAKKTAPAPRWASDTANAQLHVVWLNIVSDDTNQNWYKVRTRTLDRYGSHACTAGNAQAGHDIYAMLSMYKLDNPNITKCYIWLDGAGNLHNAGLLAILADSEAHTGIRVLEVNHNEGAIQAACRRLPPSHE